MPHRQNPFLLTKREASRFLGVPGKRIRSLVERGRLTPQLVDGKEYFHEAELAKFRLYEREVAVNTFTWRLLKAMGSTLKLICHGRNGRHHGLDREDYPEEVGR
jgi:hypothetical protein